MLQTKSYITFWLTFLVLSAAIGAIYLAKDLDYFWYFTSAYWVSATLCHTLHVLVHELTHMTGLLGRSMTRMLAIMCNVPMGIPSAVAFSKYHSEHHNYLGDQIKDPDLPTALEAALSVRMGRPYRWINLIFSCFFYAIRPLLVYRLAITKWEVLNVAFILSTNFLIYYYWGLSALAYTILSALLSIGPHPASMHIFAEHFEVISGIETYDYFGPANIINLNLGYHIEHHDFPTCPWYNLSKLRALAPEFYENVPYHTSYFAIMWKMLIDPKYTLFLRTVRQEKLL